MNSTGFIAQGNVRIINSTGFTAEENLRNINSTGSVAQANLRGVNSIGSVPEKNVRNINGGGSTMGKVDSAAEFGQSNSVSADATRQPIPLQSARHHVSHSGTDVSHLGSDVSHLDSDVNQPRSDIGHPDPESTYSVNADAADATSEYTYKSWSDAQHILCVRLDNMGDVLMTSPAVRALRNARPGRRVTLLASSSGAAVTPLLPEVDATLVYDAPWVKNDAPHGPEVDFDVIAALRAETFDAAVIFTVYSQSALPAALMCRLAGIPLVLAHSRENPYRLLTDWVRDDKPLDNARHEVQRQLDLVASIGVDTADTPMRIRVPDAARQRLRHKLAAHGVDIAKGWLALHPGASAPSRRYPAERFGAALKMLQPRLPVVITGGAQERDLAAQVCISAGFGANLAGQLTLDELAALIAGADVLVCNNSGPAHLAAALGTPVVDLYALTNPQHTPWQVPQRVLFHDVPCRHCYRSVCPEEHHRCLLEVSPQRVANATHELLAEVETLKASVARAAF